jgi:hypothetical protein
MGFTKAHHGHPRSTRGTAPRPPGFPSTVSRMPSHERPRSDSRGLVFLPPLSGLSQYVECSEACCGGGSVSAGLRCCGREGWRSLHPPSPERPSQAGGRSARGIPGPICVQQRNGNPRGPPADRKRVLAGLAAVPPHPRLASWSSASAYRVETCRAPGALRLREPVHGEHDLRGDQRVMRSGVRR